MIPENITRGCIHKAIEEIDEKGVLPNRKSKKYLLEYNDKYYPPKYVISLANKYVNGRELEPSEFNGGKETNSFLRARGFTIVGMHHLKNDNPNLIYWCTCLGFLYP